MGFGESLLIYLLVGAAVATAMYLVDDRRGAARGAFIVATAVLFWPLYLPVLLSARGAVHTSSEPARASESDEMSVAIAQVEKELDAALASLDGWAERTVAGEDERIVELRRALAVQASRIREMDHLLARTPTRETEPSFVLGAQSPDGEAVERWQKSQSARTQNLARLTKVRHRAHTDLMATLAWIRELVSMIHLARFTGAPASRAEELVAQIAAAIEGVSAVAWREPCITETSHGGR